MQTWVLASNNLGKVREFGELLADLAIQVLPQSDFGVQAIDETGPGFIENALLKARHAVRCTGLPALADDSGLEVDALAGAPGVYSARYAGANASDEANVQKLLHDLKDVPAEQRTARFQCVLVWVRHAADPTPLVCQGTWEGTIALAASGVHGFGYDPVFYVPREGLTAAQMTALQKNRLSHRGQALAKLLRGVRAQPLVK